MALPLLLISILLITTVGCSNATNTSTSSNTDFGLIEEGKLYVATNPTYAPFEYMEGNEIVGFDIELMDKIGEMAGLEVVYTSMDFSTIIPAVNSGQYDVGMSGFSITEERKKSVLFGDPYFSSAQVAMLPLDSTVTSVEELKGKKLGAGLGTTGEQAAQELSTDLTLAGNDVTFPMLMTGQLDAYIGDLNVVQQAVATGNYKLLDEEIQKEEMAMVFKLENTALADELNKYLAEYMETQEYQDLLLKYGVGGVTTTVEIFTVENLKYLLGGAVFSVLVALGALVIGLLLGTIFAAMRISKNKVLNTIAYLYIQFIRGTPMLLQILAVFFGYPVIYSAITGDRITMNPVIVGIVAIGINSGAYSAELIRSGIEGIDKGQWEAAKSLGLNYKQTMQYIILPLAFRRLIPPFVSEFVMLIKDSSLIFAIGGLELLGRSKVISAQTYSYILPLIFASIIYLVLTSVVSYFASKIERRYADND